MPYISKNLRKQRDTFEHGQQSSTPGELNYMITRLCLGYIEKLPKTYTTFNEVIGVMECAKLEFYRKKIAPYEEIKEQENGTVW